MQIRTTRFGSVSIEETQIVTFSEGLPGFEAARSFVLLPQPGGSASPFRWLQCIDGTPGSESLAMPVLDPWLIDPDYTPSLPTGILRELGFEERMQDRAKFWAVVTVPNDHPELATVNLFAPVLINTETMQGRQVALLSERYQLRTPLRTSKPSRLAEAPQEKLLAVA